MSTVNNEIKLVAITGTCAYYKKGSTSIRISYYTGTEPKDVEVHSLFEAEWKQLFRHKSDCIKPNDRDDFAKLAFELLGV